MSEMTLPEARSRLSEAVDTAQVNHEAVYLLRRGRRSAVLIGGEDLATLIEAAEDLAGLRVANAAGAEMADTGSGPMP